MIGDPKSFNPITAQDNSSRTSVGWIFDTLIRIDPHTTEPTPNLAKSWNCSADGLECVFSLRDNIYWHDGTPFTAGDVAFTFEAIHTRSVPNVFKSFLSIDGEPIRAEALDDQRVRFRLPRPFAPFASSLAVPIVPRHLLADSLAAGNFAEQWGIDTPPQDIVGTGPFQMVEFRRGEVVGLKRNPHYWRRDDKGFPLPYLEEHRIRITADRKIQRELFLAGETLIYNPLLDEVEELVEASHRLDIAVEEIGLDTGAVFLTFNRNPARPNASPKKGPTSKWFKDRRFLLAIAHSIDKGAIVEQTLYGLGIPAISYISPANQRFHDTEIVDYTYDPKVARKILDDAGYTLADGATVRSDAEGNRVEFDLTTNAGNAMRMRTCAILVENLAAVGIGVRFHALEFADLFEKLDSSYDWDTALLGYTGGIDPSSSENLLRSSGGLHIWHPRQTIPATTWEAEIDGLLEAGSRQLDFAQRREIYNRIQEVLHAELPMIQIARPKLFAAYSTELRDFRPTAWGVDRPEELSIAEPIEATRSAKPQIRRGRRPASGS
jgi:peptide/nickel transport system substrate-binding protein